MKTHSDISKQLPSELPTLWRETGTKHKQPNVKRCFTMYSQNKTETHSCWKTIDSSCQAYCCRKWSWFLEVFLFCNCRQELDLLHMCFSSKTYSVCSTRCSGTSVGLEMLSQTYPFTSTRALRCLQNISFNFCLATWWQNLDQNKLFKAPEQEVPKSEEQSKIPLF